MTMRKRHVLIGLGSVIGIAAIAVGIFVATLDQDKVKRYISAGVSKATGRQLSINGDLKLDLGWISRVTANQIQFANAEWSKHAQMAEIENFEVQIDLWQLGTAHAHHLATENCPGKKWRRLGKLGVPRSAHRARETHGISRHRKTGHQGWDDLVR
jgi:hypothetical protein